MRNEAATLRIVDEAVLFVLLKIVENRKWKQFVQPFVRTFIVKYSCIVSGT